VLPSSEEADALADADPDADATAVPDEIAAVVCDVAIVAVSNSFLGKFIVSLSAAFGLSLHADCIVLMTIITNVSSKT
jgi:hypothetical protein